jgi:hypothetical protein
MKKRRKALNAGREEMEYLIKTLNTFNQDLGSTNFKKIESRSQEKNQAGHAKKLENPDRRQFMTSGT